MPFAPKAQQSLAARGSATGIDGSAKTVSAESAIQF
jgi:hypothetical protein